MFGAGTKLAITRAGDPGLSAGVRWPLAGGVAAFMLALALLHVGAEWTSLRDRAFLGRLALAAFGIALAAIGGDLEPIVFVALLTLGVLGQLLVEAFTFPVGAASIVQPLPAETALTPAAVQAERSY